MELIQMIYRDQPIDVMQKAEQCVMVNATQMAGIFNKDVRHFTKSEQTKRFIKKLENYLENEIIRAPNGERIIQKAIDYRGRNGVYFERRLALKFASWLDEEIDFWIINEMDRIILGAYKQHKIATIEKLKAKQELEDKKNEIILNNPHLAEYFQIEGKIKVAVNEQKKALRLHEKEVQMRMNL